MTSLRGILPAIVTPLAADGELCTSAFENLIARMYEAGCDGLYVCGNTGEGMQLPAAIREKAAEIALANSPAGKQVIVHVGAYCLNEAIRLTRHASRLGVSAVSSLPPGASYNFGETRRWYEALAHESTVPFLVYHFPSLSQPMSVEQLEALCGIPGVAGLKFTSFDLYTLRLLAAGGHVVFNGHDEVLAAGLLMGAHGGIGSTYNVMPELFVRLFREAGAGNWNEAIRIQDEINRVIRVLLRYPLVSALKQILTWQGIECGQAVSPRDGLTGEQQLSLRDTMETIWNSKMQPH